MMPSIHRILLPQVVGYAKAEEGVHPLVLAMCRHVAVIPVRTELGQIDGHNLVDMVNLRASQKGSRTVFEDSATREILASLSGDLRSQRSRASGLDDNVGKG